MFRKKINSCVASNFSSLFFVLNCILQSVFVSVSMSVSWCRRSINVNSRQMSLSSHCKRMFLRQINFFIFNKFVLLSPQMRQVKLASITILWFDKGNFRKQSAAGRATNLCDVLWRCYVKYCSCLRV